MELFRLFNRVVFFVLALQIISPFQLFFVKWWLKQVKGVTPFMCDTNQLLSFKRTIGSQLYFPQLSFGTRNLLLGISLRKTSILSSE